MSSEFGASAGGPPSAAADLAAEIEQRLGYLPAVFLPALSAPDVLLDLWGRTRLAYLESPLPPRLRERLLTHLARRSAQPYCALFHGSALLRLGEPA
ncbi:MAG: hypothetical protein ACK4N5_08460, partial [Myxococcales bacterium]